MKYVRIMALLALTLSILLISSGCIASFWVVNAIRYTKTGELYDDRDPEIVRRPNVLGKSYLVVEVDVTYYGNETYPNADIRDNLDFEVWIPGTGIFHNLYEDESWDFYDAIEPTFARGDRRTGSIFFEIPDISVYEGELEIRSYEDIEMSFSSWIVLEKKLGDLVWVSGYPELW